MPDEFWFTVNNAVDVVGADGSTIIGRLDPGTPYRAMDANDHWLAIPGPNNTRGFVSIQNLDYVEVTPQGEPVAAQPGAGTSASEQPAAEPTPVAVATRPTEDDLNGNGAGYDSTAYVHTGDADDGADAEFDPSAEQRRLRQMAAIAGAVVVVLILLISILGGDDAPTTTTIGAQPTTTVEASTTTEAPAVSTTLPPEGTTPGADVAPKKWQLAFYNDFEGNRHRTFAVGPLSQTAEAEIVDGRYVVSIDSQAAMETSLIVPFVARSGFVSATIEETLTAPGAHVCGLIFMTDTENYLVTVNARVTSGPREYAVLDGTGNQVQKLTASSLIKAGPNHIGVVVKPPVYRLLINGEQVAKGEIEGTQFTGFGLTYGAATAGMCTFDDVEIWKPEPRTETPDDAAPGDEG